MSVESMDPVVAVPAAPGPALSRVVDVNCGWGATTAALEWKDVGAVRAALGARGIGHAFLSASLSRRYDLAAGNDALAGALDQSAGGGTELHGWLVIHPARAADSNVLMRKHLYNSRFVGAALFPDPITGAPVTQRETLDLINSFRRYARPLLIETPTAEAMAHAVQIADTLGSIKVIASGMGGDEWHEAIPMTAHLLNLYLDISGALVPEKITYAISLLHGTRKLLFASRAPQTDPAAVLGMLDDLSLSGEDREKILVTNASRLFHLGPAAEAPTALAPIPFGGALPAPAPDVLSDLLATLGQSENDGSREPAG